MTALSASAPPAHRRRRRGRFGGWALVLCTVATMGCAKRYALTPKQLERVKTEAGVQPLRVYTNKKLIAIHSEAAAEESFQVQKTIREASAKEEIKATTTKNTAGLILAIDELNGAPLLWVTFDPGCSEPDCAYGFVETEDKTYRLAVVPQMEGYAPPRVYRGCKWKRRRLKKGKLASLAEANEVFLVKKRNGKILTVNLEVKKVVDDRTKTKTRRSRGID